MYCFRVYNKILERTLADMHAMNPSCTHQEV